MMFKVTDLEAFKRDWRKKLEEVPTPDDLPTGPPLRKVVDSRPFPPKKDEEDDDESLENRRALP